MVLFIVNGVVLQKIPENKAIYYDPYIMSKSSDRDLYWLRFYIATTVNFLQRI